MWQKCIIKFVAFVVNSVISIVLSCVIYSFIYSNWRPCDPSPQTLFDILWLQLTLQPLHYLMVMQIFFVQMQNGSVRWEVQRWMGLSKYYAKMLSRQSLNILSSIFIFSPTGQNKSMDLFWVHVQNQSHSLYTGSLEGGRFGQQTCLQLPLPEAHAPWVSWVRFK